MSLVTIEKTPLTRARRAILPWHSPAREGTGAQGGLVVQSSALAGTGCIKRTAKAS